MRKNWLLSGLATTLGLVLIGPWLPSPSAPQATHSVALPKQRLALPPSASPPPAAVIINEVAWGGTAANPADEWIELLNTTGATVTLDGWHLTAADGSPDIALAGTVGPYATYLIERTDDTAVNDVAADLSGSFGSGLGNGGESLGLFDAVGTLVDSVNDDGGPWPNGDDGASPLFCSLERVSPFAPDEDANWVSNDGTVTNGLDATGDPITGTPKARNAAFLPTWASHSDLAVHQSGPVTAAPGTLITYTLQVANLGGITTTDVRLTDTLPLSLTFVAQQSAGDIPFTPTARTLVWHIATLAPEQALRITATTLLSPSTVLGAEIVNTLTAATVISELTTANNTASWATSVVAQVPDDQEAELVISGVLYDGYQLLDGDEAVEITNVGNAVGSLTGWSLCKEVDAELSCRELTGPLLPALIIPPGGSVWLARNAAAFAASFGFSPTCELDSWPGLTNAGDEVILRSPDGSIVDALVYGEGDLTGPAWDGAPLTAYTNGLRGEDGQILSRRRDETTGLPVLDTNTAADWSQYPDDATTGRRVRYPGWDAGDLFMPLTATEEATLILGIAPDNAFQVISETLMRARNTISIETYTLTHPEIIDILVQKAAQGVDVALLLEGSPVGLGDQTLDWQLELHACERIETAGGRCYFMIHETEDHIYNRYPYLHAKMIIVDSTWVAIGSQNLTPSSLPADSKANGTLGSRGTVIVTDSPAVAARAATIFALDLDPARHSDILRWNTGYTERYGIPSADLVVPEPTDGISYTVRFSAPLVISGTFGLEFYTAPDAALRNSDALLGLVNRAGEGDEILVEQLYEHAVWAGDSAAGVNVRLAAYIDAARRGARVRILLNGLSYIDDYEGPDPENLATTRGLNTLARSEGLDLRAAVGNPTTAGIHNKMVLIHLDEAEPEGILVPGFAAGYYTHISSINGSEAASKVNREVALQVASEAAYAYAGGLFWVDWHLSNPVYFPLIAQSYTPPPPPAPYPVISEIAYAVATAAEWVELHNPTGLPVDLTGWKVGDAEAPDVYEPMFRFPASTQLQPGATLVIAVNAAVVPQADLEFYESDPHVPNMEPYPAWGDSRYPFALRYDGDQVLLLSGADEVVDVVVWGDRTYPGVTPHPGVALIGASLERDPAYRDTDDCNLDFRERYPPTPGELPTQTP